MPWRDSLEPARMQRVAIIAPREDLRPVLVEVAASGLAELDVTSDTGTGEAARRLQRVAQGDSPPTLLKDPPDLDALVQAGRDDLLIGEAQLEQRSAAAVNRGLVSAVAGWVPVDDTPDLTGRLAELGAAVVPLPNPRGTDPPTLLHTRGRLNQPFAPLVDTYATVPYSDVDPTAVAGLAFVFMYGMMFADAGQGLLLLIGGIMLRFGRPSSLARFRSAWLFITGAGLAAMFFGVLFGEFFGPTGVLPVLWVEPLEEPVLLLEVAIGIGAVLLSGAYAIGTMNRWREGGWRLAIVSATGLAGVAVFLGLGLLLLGAFTGISWLAATGVVVLIGGLVLTYVGLLAAAGGGGAGAAQAGVELFDGVLRLGTSLVSFARLAAFGLAHAALGAIVWQATTGLWSGGGLAMAAAVLVFVIGNTLTFVLQAVVAGVQALRLEYYELFSRVFVSEGRPFRAWLVPTTLESVP
ncbi:MAG: V-type ATPase 116kDa subunit family protein [Candidatus Nanopelagicales bacterium]